MDDAQEAGEAADAAGDHAAEDAVFFDVAVEGVVVFHAEPVGVDEELVRVALGAVVQPGARGEEGEGVGDHGVEALGGGVGGRGGGGEKGGGSAGRCADFIVGLPVRLLAVAVAVVYGLALGASHQACGGIATAGALVPHGVVSVGHGLRRAGWRERSNEEIRIGR